MGLAYGAATVRFSNSDGVERSTKVGTASLFEAARRRWAKFKSKDETFDESFLTEEFVIESHKVSKNL